MHHPAKKITVMLVDDSSVIRRAISMILDTEPSIEIIASVPDGQMAISMTKHKKPDVMILDVEMPVMDGLTALPEILKNSPNTKIVMCSSMTAKNAHTTIKAMTLGAVECLVKPRNAKGIAPNSSFQKNLLDVVCSLGPSSNSTTTAARTAPALPSRTTTTTAATVPETPLLRDDATAYTGKPDIIAIGSSTGGPKALFKVLSDLGPIDIPIVITQHMPATFTKILAEHITQQSGSQAHEGEDGMTLNAGEIYVAPGGKHMLFGKHGDTLKIQINDGQPENFCKPSVDPMMRSLIDIYGKKILCVILTGMGNDGLKSAQHLAKVGGRVIAQDHETSVVWGMPGAVSNAGICSAVLPLTDIGAWIRKACTPL